MVPELTEPWSCSRVHGPCSLVTTEGIPMRAKYTPIMSKISLSNCKVAPTRRNRSYTPDFHPNMVIFFPPKFQYFWMLNKYYHTYRSPHWQGAPFASSWACSLKVCPSPLSISWTSWGGHWLPDSTSCQPYMPRFRKVLDIHRVKLQMRYSRWQISKSSLKVTLRWTLHLRIGFEI